MFVVLKMKQLCIFTDRRAKDIVADSYINL